VQLEHLVVLVTGGASGLGRAAAETLTRGGARVVLADRDGAAAGRVAAALGSSARAIAADVTREDDVAQAIDLAVQAFGGLRGVVNAAGIAPAGRTVGRSGPLSLDTFAHVVQVNLIGTFNVVRLAAATIQQQPPLATGERGVIINTASVAAFDGQIGQAAYAASKGGVVSLTLPLAREFARAGIRVMTIAPGIFDTPMLAGLPDTVRQSLGAQVPFPPRLGRPDEYAALVRHIVENEMLNGEVIRLDGAIRMGPQ
jgi:NAD(P)-dependent dehydrogenase (short-subunit alcohol dehydrogenase family)